MNETIQWIDVDDRLPDDDISVLVACRHKNATEYEVYEAYRDSNKGGWSSPDMLTVQNVLYWAEMPAGPS
jgi:hypothetical protein